MITLISFIVLLGILIFVHEFGHFLAARIAGVGVLKFSLGFGPKIIRQENRRDGICAFLDSFRRICQTSG